MITTKQTMPKVEGVSLRKLKNKAARLRERAALFLGNTNARERLNFVEEAIKKKGRFNHD